MKIEVFTVMAKYLEHEKCLGAFDTEKKALLAVKKDVKNIKGAELIILDKWEDGSRRIICSIDYCDVRKYTIYQNQLIIN